MADSFVQGLFAQRIGGDRFGKEQKVYKFEKIKRARDAAVKAHPGMALIDMGVGEPDEAAFPEVVARLSEEAGRWENRTYADNGIVEFREAVARYMSELYQVHGLDVQKEICHSVGSKNALSMMPAVFINPKDVTLMTIPGYPVMGTHTQYYGGEVVHLPLEEKNHFLPDLDAIPADILKRVKLLYLNYPNNPTGAVATESFYDHAIEWALRNRVVIVSDAAYAPLAFQGKPLSILSRPGGKEVAVELHSMSKGFNMTGWRLGWVVGQPLAVAGFATVKDNFDSGQFRAIQKAAICALDCAEQITPKICEKYSRRLGLLVEALRQVGFDAKKPEGSFYLYVRIPRGVGNGQAFSTAEEFSQFLITEKLVSTVPWDDVGAYVRFSATFVARGEAEEQRVVGEMKERMEALGLVF